MPIVPVNRSKATASPAPAVPPPPPTATIYNFPSPPPRTRVVPVAEPTPVIEPAPKATKPKAKRVKTKQKVVEPKPTTKRRAHHKVDRTGPNWNADGTYNVGKGKPDPKHQWKPGQSGNPAGPKEAKPMDPMEEFDRKLLAPYDAVINGTTQTITNLDFGVQALKKAAANGTAKAAEGIIRLCFEAMERQVERNRTPEMEQWEQAAVDRMLEQFGLPPRPVIRADRRDDDDDPS